MRTVAPAKINWTLEVLGRREDGYHEVRTVMQTIDLCDELDVAESSGFEVHVEGAAIPRDENLVHQAAELLAEATGRPLRAEIRLRKHIPPAAGLGGGSSDAAATLRALNRLWRLDLGIEALASVAERVGSDVAFFLRGGTALVAGRGEQVLPLPDVPETWLVVAIPEHELADKTRRMFGELSPGDFSDGSRSQKLAEGLRRGEALDADALCNAFERAADVVFDGLEAQRRLMQQEGAGKVHLAGAGPSLFAVCAGESEARGLAGRLSAAGLRSVAARTLGAVEATAIVE